MSASSVLGDPVLRVEDLRYNSEGFQLGPVNFRLRRGETLAVFGPNGAGKSTLLRLLAGLESAVGGRIWIDGVEVTRVPSYRRGVGMVFQDLALFPQLSVWENLAYGPRAHRWPAQEVSDRVEELLRDFRLSRLADRRPDRLSGGEQQRVALARALAPRPRLLLFDEPLSSADPDLRPSLQREIRSRISTDGLASVYVTHDLDEGSALASRMAFLKEGRWVLEGDAEEVRAAPRSRFVAEFLGFNVRPTPGGWVGTDPSRTEIVERDAPASVAGIVLEVRQDGELARIVAELSPGESGPGTTVRSVQWGRRPSVEVGEAVGIRFGEEIPLADD
ncbi:MAG: ABC transporter ATP-binding protein [Thermoplasmata archaeon]|nr:ABC transporter ATP-binding protein [Thermoplasmata archaeon]